MLYFCLTKPCMYDVPTTDIKEGFPFKFKHIIRGGNDLANNLLKGVYGKCSDYMMFVVL